MKFKNAHKSLEWYAANKANPIAQASMTEMITGILSGERSFSSVSELHDGFDWDDVVNMLIDMDRILDKLPPFIRHALIVYGIHDFDKAVTELRQQSKFHRHMPVEKCEDILNSHLRAYRKKMRHLGLLKESEYHARLLWEVRKVA